MTALHARALGAGILMGLAVAPSIAHARCSEAYPIVGYSNCQGYGSWELLDIPRLSMRVGSSFHLVSLEDPTVTATTGKNQPTVGVPSSVFKGLEVKAFSFDWGPTGFVGGPIYLGPRLQVGPAFVSGTPTTTTGYKVDASTGVYFSGGLLVGAAFHSRSFLPLAVRVELLGGGRFISITGKSLDPAIGSPTALTFMTSAWLLEPRIAVEYWSSSWMSVSAWAGKSIAAQSDTSMGLMFGFHLMPYDLPRSAW
ncbi:MAG: hypothetical protein U0165_02610 [Polyangiaceae bacterium]